jgi:hypothetical protein
MDQTRSAAGLGVASGAALYVGAVLGPGPAREEPERPERLAERPRGQVPADLAEEIVTVRAVRITQKLPLEDHGLVQEPKPAVLPIEEHVVVDAGEAAVEPHRMILGNGRAQAHEDLAQRA